MAGFNESEVGGGGQQWISVPDRVYARLNVLASDMRMPPSEVIETAISLVEMASAVRQSEEVGAINPAWLDSEPVDAKADEDVMSIQEQTALNAGLCLAWNCESKAGSTGYCRAHWEGDAATDPRGEFVEMGD